MPSGQRQARTTGSAGFDPDTFFEKWASSDLLPKGNDLRTSIVAAFNLSPNDSYVYHAIASVTLSQVQEAIIIGGEHGLHAWYLNDNGEPVEY